MTDQERHDFDPLEAAFITAAKKEELPAALKVLRDFNTLADDLTAKETSFTKRARGAFSLAAKLRDKEHTGLVRKFEAAQAELMAIDKTAAANLIARTQARISKSVLALQN